MLEIAIGVITLWAGAIGNIPPGWHLCDGTEGTPDLRRRFLISSGPNFAVGDHGEDITHTHNLTTDGHTHEFLEPPGQLNFGPGFSRFTQSATDTSTTDIGASSPPHYALAYIQFLGD